MTEKMRRLGLRVGDSLMVADGYRVRDQAQWAAVRSFSDERRISTIVFRGGGYLEVAGLYVRVKFGPPAPAASVQY
jgi:hypothetical protein